MTASRPVTYPPSSAVGQLLGTVRALIAEGRLADAIGPLREAATLQPDDGRILVDLGQLCIETGQPAAALAPLQRAIALDPKSGSAYWRLGTALQLLRAEGAGEALARAVTLDPSLSDAHYRLGHLYQERGRLAEALECYRYAARTATERPVRQFLQGRVFIMEGREAEAEALLRRAIKLQPDMALAHNYLGELLAGQGRFDEAAESYKAELDVSPTSVGAFYNLVRCRRITPEDEALLPRMDAILQSEGLDDLQRATLQLARGKAFDDLGRYDKAMEAWDLASEARARHVKFDPAEFETEIDSIIAAFDADVLARYAAAGSDDRTPVLIVGMPRSGTTLCEQIVSSHPDAAGAGEVVFWERRLPAVLESGFDDTAIGRWAAHYLGLLRSVSATAQRISDKEPFNFFCLGLIHLAFPRAAIIHCRRDPLDTALSIHQTHFAAWRVMPTGGEDLVRYYRGYERLMAHWRKVLPAGRMLEVDYEAITASPEPEIRKITDYVGLPWNEACLRPHDNTRTVRTPSRWQVRQPINRGSVERWRRYEPWLGPLAALGRTAG